MSIEDRYLKMMDDPDKRARAFKIIWLAGYFMLVLGSLLTVYFLWKTL